ncbi:hypothetical protein HPP92_016545 [Vanilla planifolia]|uniref:Uncharacterized protein n=1 Tax=Vanilla planifolia TaxID=51239 RepID=A0A835UQK2_VANPL|nr:hypothetical protein HPP92_016545 [Vanilla planifolia]
MKLLEKLVRYNASWSSSTPDLFDFTFRLPPANDVIYSDEDIFLPFDPTHKKKANSISERPKIRDLRHQRAELLDWNNRRQRNEACAADYERLKSSPSCTKTVFGGGSRPMWLMCVIGAVRFPAEMEMKEIKTRQRRRRSTAVKTKSRRHSWGILQSLSCWAADSVAVASLSSAG